MKNLATLSFLAAAGVALLATGAHAADGIRKEPVRFEKGASQAAIKARIQGDETVDYVLRAGAGQTLAVGLKKTNPQNYFNVLPPGTQEAAMFVGDSGADFKGTLPTDGDYTVRVYLMRPAARRNESSDYTLTVGVTGQALAPTAAPKDALIPGTSIHASAKVKCVPFLETKQQECDAFIVRRGFDGTATVEIPQAASGRRRILFVKGQPVASDSTDPLTFTRQGDVTTVKLGTDERYEIPDALVTGG
jgi:hypothetical protein